MDNWQYHDNKMIELKKIYNKVSKQTQNRLQEIFDSVDFDFNNLYNIAESKTKKRIDTYIEEWQDKGLLTGYFGTLAKNIKNRTRVKNSEILELLIYGAYIEEQSKVEEKELNTFKDVANYYYKQGQEEVNKTLNKKKVVSVIPDAIFLALMDMPNSKGYVWNKYIEAIIKFNADQIYRQATIDLQQEKELDITNDIYQTLIKRQQNSKLNINGDKISGDVDLTLIGINNQAKIEGIYSFDEKAKCKFMSVEDEATTKMCHSLNGQEFYIHDWKEFERYSKSNDCIKKYRCYGLVTGLNLPPINDGFHWCRSTITYQYDKVNNIELEQGNYSGNKEKMNWQEQNEKLESTIIKPELYSNKSKEYRIKKYENEIMKLYNKNGNENMCILDIDTGELIGNITEGKNKTTVGLDTTTMLKLITHSKISVIAIHNHPENFAFSLTDIQSFNKIKQIDTMVVLTDNYKYYLKSNTTKKYTTEYIKQLYKKVEKRINKKYNNLNNVERRDLINQDFFKKVGWIYEKEKN